MDLDNELNPTRKKERESSSTPLSLSPQEIERSYHGWQVLSSQGNLSLLRTLQEIQKSDIEKAQPMDGPEPTDEGPSELKRFLLSDHNSHFLKLEELKQYIADAQQSVTLIDATDKSGASLYNFIPEEARQEVEAQLSRLSNTENIKKSLQTDINALAPNLWEDHLKIRKALSEDAEKESQTLLLGDNPSEKNKKALHSLLQEETSQEIQEVSELICLEKCRVALAAITAPAKTKTEKVQEAETFLGEDFSLLDAQVAHMEKILEKDWQNALANDWAEGEEPIINPTSGADLLCPELRVRIESPSETQIKTLEDLYSNMAYRKTSTPSAERDEDQKIAFLLGSMSILEEGKKANSLQRIQNIEQEMEPEVSEDYPDHPSEESPSDDLTKLRRVASGQEALKRGLIKTLKGAGHKALAYGATASLHKLRHAWEEKDPKVAEYLQSIKTADGDIDHPLR